VAALGRMQAELEALPAAVESLRAELAQAEQVKRQAEAQLAAARAPGDAVEQRISEQLPRYEELRAAAGFQ
ncbi:MAG: hypothetical protein ACIAXF_01145, partial [Phycisphaerales bacterium JB063]